jgi:hypothetical protein
MPMLDSSPTTSAVTGSVLEKISFVDCARVVSQIIPTLEQIMTDIPNHLPEILLKKPVATEKK